jgi:enoyl-CoA hydratase/carnithine racemase
MSVPKLSYIKIEKHHGSGIGELILNRPSKLNVMDDQFFEDYDVGLSHLLQFVFLFLYLF